MTPALARESPPCTLLKPSARWCWWAMLLEIIFCARENVSSFNAAGPKNLEIRYVLSELDGFAVAFINLNHLGLSTSLQSPEFTGIFCIQYA